jgi:DegV family protein with EDD domain
LDGAARVERYRRAVVWNYSIISLGGWNMQIVTDRGADLAPEQLAGLDISYAQLLIQLDGKTYRSGVDLDPNTFYEMLGATESFPTTSQPSAGEFAELYRGLAVKDPDIFSIHISSGLSGTLNSARAGANMVPEANITFFDTMTLSVPEGWMVEAAVRMLRAGWPMDAIIAKLEDLRKHINGIFTLNTLKYLIHGGRISHIKGLMASLLNIKPIICVDKVKGMYDTVGQEITLKRAIGKMAETLEQWYPLGTRMRVQLLHGNNMDAVEILRAKMVSLYDCVMEPVTAIAPVLGAHTGPGLVGMSVAPMAVFDDIP